MARGTKWGGFRTFGVPYWDNIIGDASRRFLTQSSERTAEVVLGSFLCGPPRALRKNFLSLVFSEIAVLGIIAFLG